MHTPEPTQHDFPSQRLRMRYVDWGNADAPTILLIHGARDHARSWDAVAQALRHDWHVVAVDLRGHGDSDWSPDGAYAAPYFVGDLDAFVRHLGDAPVTIVAHSLGAAISLRFAGLYPERVTRLAAIEGLGLIQPERDKPFDELWRTFIDTRAALPQRTPRSYATLDDATARMHAANPHLSPELARHLTVHGVRENSDATLSWKFDNFLHARFPADISNEQLRALWRAITCPVWLVHGGASWARHPTEEGRAAEFRDARITSFPGAGHWVHHDSQDAFVTALKAFLADA